MYSVHVIVPSPLLCAPSPPPTPYSIIPYGPPPLRPCLLRPVQLHTGAYRHLAHDMYRFKVFCTAPVVRYRLPARKLVERVIVGWQLNFNINTNSLIIDFDSPLFANTYHEEGGGGGPSGRKENSNAQALSHSRSKA